MSIKNLLVLIIAALWLMTLSCCQTPKVIKYTNQYGEVYDYGRFSIPEKPSIKPNKATLQTYFDKWKKEALTRYSFIVKPSNKPFKFETNLRKAPSINKELNRTALISYFLYEGGRVVVDELTPEHRFGNQVKNSTPLTANSIGKSFTSYVLGHAICSGHIANLESNIGDWPLMEGTLYSNQKLVDLVNLRAGDQKYIGKSGLAKTGENENNKTLATIAHYYLKGTEASSKRYFNYSELPSRIVFNYIAYKLGKDFQSFISRILQEKVGVEHPVYFKSINGIRPASANHELGVYRDSFYAARHDYLRLARAMLTDWKNNTCEGKYLKEIFAKRIRKRGATSGEQRDLLNPDPDGVMSSYKGYGGFFQADFALIDPKRHILAMDGYAGQMIIIDFDSGRIVVTNAIHRDFNWKRIVRDVIRTGKLVL